MENERAVENYFCCCLLYIKIFFESAPNPLHSSRGEATCECEYWLELRYFARSEGETRMAENDDDDDDDNCNRDKKLNLNNVCIPEAEPNCNRNGFTLGIRAVHLLEGTRG